MSNLWDDEDDLTDEPQPSGQQLGAIEPGQLVAFESNKQNAIIRNTSEFAIALKSCEGIVVAAYRVADYVPPFQNDKQSVFWKNTVIPILVRSLKQDVTARSLITRSYGTVRDLAVVIQSVYEIVRRSKGSKKGIEIAKKNIPAALEKLNQCIALVEQLDSNAIQSFAEQSEQIFEIIGPEAAKFAEMKEELDERIRKLRNKQQDLISLLGKKKGEVESNYYLIAMSEKHLSSTEDDLKAAKERTNELNKMNDNIETTIQNIPQKIKKTVTSSGSGGWWFWRRSWNTTTTVDVDNPNRESDQNYYNNIIKSRMERVGANKQDESAKKKAIDELAKDLANYKLAYKKANEELQDLQTSLPKDLDEIEHDIESLLAEKREIEKNALDTFEKIGLQGNTLITCLVQVRTFAKSLQPGASAYAPFASILNGIKVMVESHVDLLSSDEPSDIFLAGTLLIEQVKFISEYTVSAQKIMRTADDYDQSAIEQRMQKSLTF